jgi:hypothetical protein
MRCNQVLIVPEFLDGAKEGYIHEATSQKDAVKAYLETFVDSLDEDRVKFSVFQQGDIILPNSIVVCLSIGWQKPGSKSKVNSNEVSSGNKESEEFANSVSEAIFEWGKSYVNFNHRGSSPTLNKDNPFLKEDKTISITVSPFKLNGVNSDEYVRWLPKLGQILAHCIYEFLFSRGEQPRMMSANYR